VRGVRFAFCDLSSLSTVEMVIMLNKGIDKPSAASLLAETLVVIQAHAMMVGTNVKVVSERLVTYVDSDVLEVHRKIEAGVYAPVKE
jgi:flagellar hook assembly protein FlgD